MTIDLPNPYIETLMPENIESHGKLRAMLVVFVLVYVGLSLFGAVAAMVIPRLPLKDSLDSVGLAYSNVTFGSRLDDLLLK